MGACGSLHGAFVEAGDDVVNGVEIGGDVVEDLKTDGSALEEVETRGNVDGRGSDADAPEPSTDVDGPDDPDVPAKVMAGEGLAQPIANTRAFRRAASIAARRIAER